MNESDLDTKHTKNEAVQQTGLGAYRTHTRLAFADSGFCLIPQSFVKKLVGPACPPSQGVLVRLELYPDKDGPDFHFLGHELCLRSLRQKPITA